MILIFQKELVILKKDFFKISQLLKDQFELTGKSLEQIDVELAKKIVDKYEEFNCLAASMIKINNEIPHEILTMISIAKDMLILSIESLVERDKDKAESVIKLDAKIDRIYKNMCAAAEEIVSNNPLMTRFYIDLLGISRSIGRIANHTTNIVENTIINISRTQHHLN